MAMNNLRAIFHSIGAFTAKLLHTGVRPEMSFFEKQKIHLLNIMILPSVIPIAFFALLNLAQRPGLSVLNIANVICYLSVIGLNLSGRRLHLRLLFIVASAVIFFFEALLFHNGMEFALLLTVICSLVLVDSGWQYLLIMLGVTTGFCYLQYQANMLVHQDKAMVYRVVSTIANCLLLLTAGLYYFRGIYLKYHRQVEGHKKLLEQQQVLLLIQKQELEQNNKELKLLSESRQKILFTLAHDLRNPLSGIEALTNTMLEGGVKDQQEHNELLSVIAATANRSLKQMQELLNAHHYAGPMRVTEKTRVDVAELLQLVVLPLQHKAAEKAIVLRYELPETGAGIHANKWQIIRVMENLVTNAIKFCFPGGVVIVGAERAKGWIVLSVKDNGMGIPAEKQPFIFDNVQRVQQTGTGGEQSFGLGLAICRQIVEAHGGSISFRSVADAGTEFWVKLPEIEEDAE